MIFLGYRILIPTVIVTKMADNGAGSSNHHNHHHRAMASRNNAGAGGGDDKKKSMFFKEIRCMMVGFGDDKSPYTESIELMEELVIDFVTDMTKKALNVGRPGRVHVEDIVHLIQNDDKKWSRVRELLTMNEEIKKAKRAFDEETILKNHG